MLERWWILALAALFSAAVIAVVAAARGRLAGGVAEGDSLSFAPVTESSPTRRKILVAVAWPYASGLRHIGHVAGFGVPSDTFAR